MTRAATAQAVSDAILGAAKALKSGDLFFLTYSGHGGQVDDTNSEEKDRMDETWVCYDRQLIDDNFTNCGASSRQAFASSCFQIAATAARYP